jgi:hypothetical protein
MQNMMGTGSMIGIATKQLVEYGMLRNVNQSKWE